MTVLQASDYPKFKSIPRLHRRVVLTEKVDGTNGLIEIAEVQDVLTDNWARREGIRTISDEDGRLFTIRAGSHNRWITPENDNFGFARWVDEHAGALFALGEGKHYGEWFGKGIQSGYGLDEKRFALFNTSRWYDQRDRKLTPEFLVAFPKAIPTPMGVTVVPVISVIDGAWLNAAVSDALNTLELNGSFIAPGFMNPEGVVVYHEAAGAYFKAAIKNDESPKSLVGTSS